MPPLSKQLLTSFARADLTIVQWMQDSLLSKLSQEAQEWKTARAQAEIDGTFFMAWPHHCAVGTKPNVLERADKVIK